MEGERKRRRRIRWWSGGVVVLWICCANVLERWTIAEAATLPVPDETDAECRKRIDPRWIRRDQPIDIRTTKGRSDAKGFTREDRSGRTYAAEYCSLCTRASATQADEGFLQSGCRYFLDVNLPRGGTCVPKLTMGGLHVSRVVPSSGFKDEYQCMKHFGDADESKIHSSVDDGHRRSPTSQARRIEEEETQNEEHMNRLRKLVDDKFKKTATVVPEVSPPPRVGYKENGNPMERAATYLRKKHHKGGVSPLDAFAAPTVRRKPPGGGG